MQSNELFALISVSDKTGIVQFAKELVKHGYKIISTGGTANELKQAKLDVIEVADFIGFPEILDGRVKTLHPLVHGGILNIRNNEEHQKAVAQHNIKHISMVVVNLYPFESTVANPDTTHTDVIENIDIGGPAMVRSAAKNHVYVSVVVDTEDYAQVLKELDSGGVSLDSRERLAAKAYAHTALYDSVIARYMNKRLGVVFPKEYTIGGRLLQGLRYGENPHQEAAYYQMPLVEAGALGTAKQLHGKELSYNNIVDMHAAVELVREFDRPAAVIVKHMNPCGVALAENLYDAYSAAFASDPISSFGGIVALNREVEEDLAYRLADIFLEIIIAPSFSSKALNILMKKKNIRLMTMPELSKKSAPTNEIEFKKVSGSFLLQNKDEHRFESFGDISAVTKRQPTKEELESMEFAWIVAKYVKSNAIVYAVGTRTVGIGAGQMSRVDSSKIAASKARESIKGAVMASDAFFPFRDSIDEAAKHGITAIVSPGGSVRDDEVIEAADEFGISMIFTGVRHFKH